jgi:hypothetical protein
MGASLSVLRSAVGRAGFAAGSLDDAPSQPGKPLCIRGLANRSRHRSEGGGFEALPPPILRAGNTSQIAAKLGLADKRHDGSAGAPSMRT